MVKKKFELEENVAKLAEKYIDTTEIDWNELVNKAIKYYISKKLGINEVKAMLKENDDESAKYLDEYIQNNIDSHWNI